MKNSIMLTAALIVITITSAANASTIFSDDFTSPTWNSNFQSTNGYVIAFGEAFNASNSRSYVRTNDSDYLNFSYELTVTSAPHSGEIAFIGIGSGLPESTRANEPGFGSLMLRVHNPALASGRIDFAFWDDENNGTNTIFEIIGNHTAFNTPLRARIERSGDDLTMSYDIGYDGSFSADESRTYDLASPALAPVKTALDAESRLFFGSQFAQTKFDDFSVAPVPVPEPNSMTILLGLCFIPLLIRRSKRTA